MKLLLLSTMLVSGVNENVALDAASDSVNGAPSISAETRSTR